MEYICRMNPEPDSLYDGPSDEELQRIEEEIDKYSE